jgi:hypothetical protein
VFNDLENHTVITHPQFPIALEGLPERLSILMRGDSQSRLYRLFYPHPELRMNGRNINIPHVRMIAQFKGHYQTSW